MKNLKISKYIIILLSLIVILLSVLCILFVTGTISFVEDKNINEDNNISNNNDSNNIKNENSVLPEWADYLLSQNITEITYETGILDENEICAPAKTMTREQLKSILLKMTESKLKKYDLGGAGGPCWNGIIVKYDNERFELFMGNIISVNNNDKNIISLLEKEDFRLENTTMSDPWWVYEYDWDTSYIDTLF